jgi:hypothetical protein
MPEIKLKIDSLVLDHDNRKPARFVSLEGNRRCDRQEN